jgi:hypothetical protein
MVVCPNKNKLHTGFTGWAMHAGFPKNLAEDPEEKAGVGRGEVETANEAANFLVGRGSRATLPGYGGRQFKIAAGDERVEQS